ncbi:MAG: VIT1/CCC1 transporter family protein, partial [Pseudomonadota bacterium]
GLSMAAGSYAGTKTEHDDYKRLRAIEERHLALDPEGERREIREIYRLKGFEGPELERMVEMVTSDRGRWIDTMMTEEYGLSPVIRAPLRAALSTFLAFLICGLVPLVPFLLGLEDAWIVSAALTAVVFYAIGSLKSRWSPQPAFASGLEVLAIGVAAAGAAYGLGMLADWMI